MNKTTVKTRQLFHRSKSIKPPYRRYKELIKRCILPGVVTSSFTPQEGGNEVSVLVATRCLVGGGSGCTDALLDARCADSMPTAEYPWSIVELSQHL